MNQLNDNDNGVGGSDVPPPPRHEQIQNAVGLATGVDLDKLRSITRDKISKYIESNQYLENLRGLLPEVAMQLEEILFKVHSCKRNYHNMMEEPFETELQLALGLWSSRKQLSGQQIPVFPILGVEFDTGPTTTQGKSGNPRIHSSVKNRMRLASSSFAGMVLPQIVNMGTSLAGKDPDEYVYALLSLRLNHRPKNMVRRAQEVPREPKFICPVCMNELLDASSTICGHIFCDMCIKATIQSQRKCPTCRTKLGMTNFHRIYLPMTD